MKLSGGLFLECARRVARDYPHVIYDERIVDAACMQLVLEPTRFDMLLLPNLYGDIVSDLCAGLVRGLGVVPAANVGDGGAVFEAVHGTAPDIGARPRPRSSPTLSRTASRRDWTRRSKRSGCSGKPSNQP